MPTSGGNPSSFSTIGKHSGRLVGVGGGMFCSIS